MSIRLHSFPLLRALLMSGLGLLIVFRGRHVPPQQTPSYGCCTAQRIMDQSEPLCRVLDPRADRLSLSADHTPLGQHPSVWRVDATDEGGNKILRLMWDADTGDLWHVSVARLHGQQPVVASPPLLNSRDAAREAWRWINALGIARLASGWRLSKPPVLLRGGWWVTWTSARRDAVVHIDESTGDLVTVRSWRTQMQ